MKRKYITIFGLIMVGILLMNTALALCEDPDYGTNYLYLSPIDDAQVDSANPTQNYGSTATLYVTTNSRTSYMRFDLSSLPANSSIVSFKLLFVNNDSGYLEIKEVDSNLWTEETIVYNNRPLMGDTIDTFTFGTAPFKDIRIRQILDVTDWVNNRINNEESSVSFGFATASNNFYIHSKEASSSSEIYRPLLLVEYGNPIDPVDTTIKSQIYNYANVTDVDTYNNVFYNNNIGSLNLSFAGSESNSAYTSIGIDDGNYHRVAIPSTKYGGIRFETKIDQNISDIKRIEITQKFYYDYADSGSPMDEVMNIAIYDNDSISWKYENTDTFGNNKFSTRTYLRVNKNIVVNIVDNFDKYINEDGVLKYVMVTNDFMGDTINCDTYYYQVKVYYYEAPVVTPPVVDDDEDPIVSPVYPDLTDDTPIISVDGEYTGDLQNVLFRNLFNFNDKIGIPTWSLILLVGIIGVWKRRPELVIFCGLLFMFLLFFGYKLSMVAI